MTTKRRHILPVFICILCAAALAIGGWLWYDSHIDRSGWVEKDGIRFYQDFHAEPVSGWLDIDGGRYYFHDDGTPYFGWQEIGGKTYYFDENGVMTKGWLQLGSERYYLNTDGVREEGWLTLGEDTYYLPGGVMATEWQQIDGQRYYFTDAGRMAKGFTDLEDGRYYFGEDGVLVTGDAVIDDQQYSFTLDGIMVTGWQDTEGGRRYFTPDGPMALGWAEIEGSYYYFEENGLARIGWMQEGEYRYYLQEDGSAAVGPTVIDGETHYFTPKGIEVVLVNALNPIPSYYTVSVRNVVDYHDVDVRCYDALVQMLADCNAAGIEYIFNSAYRTMEEQTEILELRTLEHMVDFDLDEEDAREKALETVAVPGTSEHQMGLAVDLLGDEAVAWFQEHCWDYGFILRYPPEKKAITGIVNEPWHFRYVGQKVSLDMKDSGLCLEEYLGADPVEGSG